ncbi:hypothetical protein [Streptomyces sp. NBC_00120]|nr:hypothetical protein [Streptomyces sp. NBC_00120]MCX5326367.1 hypothetical protein [Streptomyces sp. NBC_00120]
MTSNPSRPHDPRTCPHCARLRHPANRLVRLALSAMPRQRTVQSGGDR